jgi:hypothetical protein
VSFLILSVALFFACMGAFALAWPDRVLANFGTPTLTRDGRNEVRAVYGGFGLAIAGVLLATMRGADSAPGVFLAVSIALFGMAGGRLVSLAVDGSAGAVPWLFFGIEVVLGGALLLAFFAQSV